MTKDEIAKNTLSALESQYKLTLEQLDSWGFFRNVAEYAKLAQACAPSKELVRFLVGQSEQARQVQRALTSTASQELAQTVMKMNRIAETVGQQTAPLRLALKEMNDTISGKILFSERLSGLQSTLFDVARQFKEMGIADKLKEFHDQQERMKTVFGSYTFSPALDKLEIEEKKLSRREQVEPWGAWGKLPFVEQMVFDPEVLAEEYKAEVEEDPSKEWDYLNFRGVWGEIEGIREGKIADSDAIYFRRSDFQVILQRVHVFFKNELLKIADSKPEAIPAKEQSLYFDDNKSILLFAGREIKIAKRSQNDAHELLRTIFKDKNKEWNTDEILEDWNFDFNEPRDKRKSRQKKVYYAGKSANKIIAVETGIQDFLVVTTKKITINTQYLTD